VNPVSPIVKARDFVLKYWPVWSFVAVFLLFIVTIFIRDPLRAVLALQRLKSEIPAARAAGVPLVAKDVYPDLPPGTPNAAPEFQQAFLARKKLSGKDHDAFNYYGTATPRPGIVQAIKDVGPALEIAKHASAVGACHFPHDPDEGAAMPLIEHGEIKSLVRCFCVRAQVRAEEGDWQGAIDDLKTARQIEECLTYPVMLTVQVRSGCERMIEAATERCVAATWSKNRQALGQFRGLAETVPTFDFLQAMRGSAYVEIASAKNQDLVDKDRNGILDTAHLEHREIPDTWREREALAQQLKSWTTLFTQLAPGETRTKAILAAFDSRHPTEVSLSAPFLGFLDNDFEDTYDEPLMTESAWRCLDDLIGVLEYRASHGSFPKSLEEAAGKDLIDPFTGKSLVYKITGSAVRIYSFGPDGVDDNGLRQGEFGRKSGATTSDIAATYPPMQRIGVLP
jgi:hypothetical protein